MRTFIGYREYPKYGMVSRYFIYKQALLDEAGASSRPTCFVRQEDIFYLTFDELGDVVRTQQVDDAAHRPAQGRVHVVSGAHAAPGAHVGGRGLRRGVPTRRRPAGRAGRPARFCRDRRGEGSRHPDMAEADLEPGDILVTAYTDPSWTPAFVVIEGLVTEVGGLMTHGAVIAREYGLPAVVGVERATQLIRDGQRIRVDGTNGYVEILS